MKQRILASFLVAILIFPLLTGCGAENAPVSSVSDSEAEKNADMSELISSIVAAKDSSLGSIYDGIGDPEVIQREGVNYGVSATVAKITPTGLTLNYYRESEDKTLGELFTGDWFALERCTDEAGFTLTWENVPLLSTAENFVWRDIAYPIPAQNKTMLTLDWSTLYGALDPGAYQLVTVLYERTSEGELYGKYYYLPFRITEEPFAGYGLTLADVPAEKMPSSDPIVKGDFRMTAEEVTPRGATLRFSHEIGGGYSYYLERYDGEMWVRVPYLPRDVIYFAFPEVGIVLRETHAVDWSSRYGELEPGVYRIAKDMGSWEYNADYFAYFEITE